MVARIPGVVGLYFREAGRWRRIAEFRLAANGHATFRAVDPVEGLVARVWFHQGVDILGEERTVLPADGVEFLRALLQPFGFRDYEFRDDSVPLSVDGRGSRGGRARRAGKALGRPLSGHTHPGNRDIAGESECGGCAEDEVRRTDGEERTARHAGARPAAWRVFDSDAANF